MVLPQVGWRDAQATGLATERPGSAAGAKGLSLDMGASAGQVDSASVFLGLALQSVRASTKLDWGVSNLADVMNRFHREAVPEVGVRGLAAVTARPVPTDSYAVPAAVDALAVPVDSAVVAVDGEAQQASPTPARTTAETSPGRSGVGVASGPGGHFERWLDSQRLSPVDAPAPSAQVSDASSRPRDESVPADETAR